MRDPQKNQIKSSQETLVLIVSLLILLPLLFVGFYRSEVVRNTLQIYSADVFHKM
jgi:hypothetical protein